MRKNNPGSHIFEWHAPCAKQLAGDVTFREGDPDNETYLVGGVVFHFIRFARWMYRAARPHTVPTPRGS